MRSLLTKRIASLVNKEFFFKPPVDSTHIYNGIYMNPHNRGRNLVTMAHHKNDGDDDDYYEDETEQNTKRKTRRGNRGSTNKRRQSYRFIDRARLKVSGGAGGKGSMSSIQIGRGGYKQKLNGGHGGNGGNVYLVTDLKGTGKGKSSLIFNKPHITAEKGSNGSSNEKHGRSGKDTIIRVPCGVIVKRILSHDEFYNEETGLVHRLVDDEGHDNHYDDESDGDDDDRDDEDVYSHQKKFRQTTWPTREMVESASMEEEPIHLNLNKKMKKTFNNPGVEFVQYHPSMDAHTSLDDSDSGDEYDDEGNDEEDEREVITLADLDKPGSHLLVARGAKGGRGSSSYASKGYTPSAFHLQKRATPEDAEVAYLELELKLIADVGLVGFPNAGKSSLLRAMSRASPKVAPYPFTTLEPYVGCVEYRDGYQILVADIPGLVDGASEGKGRGHDFLRHIERTKSLLYIVDAAGVDGRNPVDDFYTLADEISSYGDGVMLDRKALIVANKFDLLDKNERENILFELSVAAEETGIRFDGDNDILGISAGVTGDGLAPLSRVLRNVVLQSEKERAEEQQEVAFV